MKNSHGGVLLLNKLQALTLLHVQMVINRATQHTSKFTRTQVTLSNLSKTVLLSWVKNVRLGNGRSLRLYRQETPCSDANALQLHHLRETLLVEDTG